MDLSKLKRAPEANPSHYLIEFNARRSLTHIVFARARLCTESFGRTDLTLPYVPRQSCAQKLKFVFFLFRSRFTSFPPLAFRLKNRK